MYNQPLSQNKKSVQPKLHAKKHTTPLPRRNLLHNTGIAKQSMHFYRNKKYAYIVYFIQLRRRN